MVSAEDICGSSKTQKTRDAVRERFGIDVKASNAEVAEAAQTLVLAVKPQFLGDVIGEIRDAVKPDTLIISIAAGRGLWQADEACALYAKHACACGRGLYGRLRK